MIERILYLNPTFGLSMSYDEDLVTLWIDAIHQMIHTTTFPFELVTSTLTS